MLKNLYEITSSKMALCTPPRLNVHTLSSTANITSNNPETEDLCEKMQSRLNFCDGNGCK